MMFSPPDDDDMDFSGPGTSSNNLASLFGGERSGRPGNEALTYTAPKQPKPASGTASAAGASALVHFAAVQAYLYSKNEYSTVGKMGCAIVGQHATADYRLLLYFSKEKQVASAKIDVNFKWTPQKGRYASFVDDQKQTWSLLFDTDAAALDFCKHMLIVRGCCAGAGLDTVLTIDFLEGEGSPVDRGDGVEVRYSGWLVEQQKLGKCFDSNVEAEKLYRFRIGKARVIQGWEQGMVGMRRAGRRLLLVPPSLAYAAQGAGERVPPNSTLLFDIELVRAKPGRSDSPDMTPPEQRPPSPGKEKARLLNRMARMGQAVLPKPHSEDTESEHESLPDTPVRPMEPLQRPQPVYVQPERTITPEQHMRTMPSAFIPTTAQMSLYSPQQAFMQQQQQQALLMQQYAAQGMPMNMAPAAAPQPAMVVPQPTVPTAVDSMGVAEIKSQMLGLSDKMESILGRLGQIQTHPLLVPNAAAMEAVALLHSIQRLVSENERMRKEVLEKGGKIESLNDKIADLLQKNQEIVEKSHSMLERRNESFQEMAGSSGTRVLELEQEKMRMVAELSDVTSRFSSLQKE